MEVIAKPMFMTFEIHTMTHGPERSITGTYWGRSPHLDGVSPQRNRNQSPPEDLEMSCVVFWVGSRRGPCSYQILVVSKRSRTSSPT